MPMDVCHILLRRPWQFDGKVVDDGRGNCYKFEKDGIKHTLTFGGGEYSWSRHLKSSISKWNIILIVDRRAKFSSNLQRKSSIYKY